MYFAHSGTERGGRPEPLKEHVTRVANRAADHAEPFNADVEARVAGLLHDLGKYSELFLCRLKNEVGRLDHWSAGAYVALAEYKRKAIGAALAIQGHHVGLQQGFPRAVLRGLDLKRLSQQHPLNLRLTEDAHGLLLERMQADGLGLPPAPGQSVYDQRTEPVAGMLDVRMLFSALVDADFIETEAHFRGGADGAKRYRAKGPSLKPERATAVLLDYLRKLRCNSAAAKVVNELRNDLLDACLEVANEPTGIFTLTAPTGGGKTLAMLAFALKHASVRDLCRVVMVVPYLTIIEQTARIYRAIFEPHFGEHYVLEHHSLAGTREGGERQERDNEDPGARTARLLAENWDAPLVVTTSVQMLESLFANRPAACRKLHRLAGSVILFDEVQTLPPRLAVPSLAALSRLAQRYSSTVVFSTATQPAFAHLDTQVRDYAPIGWNPREIVPERLNLFDRARRTHVHWETAEARSWGNLAEELGRDDNRQVLCIVNLKRHARRLAELLRSNMIPGLFHLSTNMCPAHRAKVLEEVRACLNPTRPRPCRLVSTQCVEAGVDVDFPVVYRTLGPLEAVAQAAGRCNRNGTLPQPGTVRIFRPKLEPGEKALYPPGGYKQATEVTLALLAGLGPQGMDTDNPDLFNRYYTALYDLVGNAILSEELEDALKRRDFVATAKLYRLIEQDAINVLVPYDPTAYRALRDQLCADGRLTCSWIRRARPYTVSLFRPKPTDTAWHFLDPAPLGRRQESDDWFVYVEPEHYDDLLGLIPVSGSPAWMV